MSSRVFAAALGAAAIAIHATSFAEPAASASASEAGGGLEEIVVTAQRRQESAQNVGIAISVLSGESLAAKSITYVNDLQNAVPSLQVEPAFGSGQPQFRIRGVGFIDYTSNNASPVGRQPRRCRARAAHPDAGTAVRHRSRRGAARTAGYAVRAQHHGRRDQLHQQPPDRRYARGIHARSTARTTSSTAKASSRGPSPRACSDGLSVATEQGGAWQRNRVTGKAWATRTRSRCAANCNGIRRRR